MGLKSVLENPNGGQLFSAYMLLIPAVILAVVVAVNIIFKLSHGQPIEPNRDGLQLAGIVVMGIPALIKFVRSR